MNITIKQKLFYDYILRYYKQNGILPSRTNIQTYFGYKSPNSISQHMDALVRKGWLRSDDDGELHFRTDPPTPQSVSALLEELRIIALSESIPIPLGARIERIHQEISLLTQWNNMDIILPPEGSMYEVCTVESGVYWRYYEKP